MTRTENAARVRLPKAERLRLLGQKPLAPGEVSVNIRIRASRKVIDALLKMTPYQRGEILEYGLKHGWW